jgi:hypothetical protein
LGAAAVEQRGGDAVARRGRETLERGDLAARDPGERRDARDPGFAVDEDRAAAALALWCAAVLGRGDPELFAQRAQQGCARRFVDLDVDAVAAKAHPMPSPVHEQAG